MSVSELMSSKTDALKKALTIFYPTYTINEIDVPSHSVIVIDKLIRLWRWVCKKTLLTTWNNAPHLIHGSLQWWCNACRSLLKLHVQNTTENAAYRIIPSWENLQQSQLHYTDIEIICNILFDYLWMMFSTFSTSLLPSLQWSMSSWPLSSPTFIIITVINIGKGYTELCQNKTIAQVIDIYYSTFIQVIQSKLVDLSKA